MGSMKSFTKSLYAAAAVALALAAAPAHASVISGTNLDFEAATPTPLTPNTDQFEGANTGTAAIPGWTINAFAPGLNEAGVWAPQAGGVFFTSPASWQGNQVGFMTTGSNISQNLNGAFTGNGGTISVQLLIGEALGGLLNPALDSITLLANGTAIGTETLAQALGGPLLTPGAFDLNTFNFAISSGLAATLTGQTLGIEFSNDADPSRFFVDDLVINGTTVVNPIGGGGGGGGGGGAGVPEPASLSILGVALLGFAAWRRRSKDTGASFSVAA
jgi:HpiC1 cyclase/PEP-CTERM motif